MEYASSNWLKVALDFTQFVLKSLLRLPPTTVPTTVAMTPPGK